MWISFSTCISQINPQGDVDLLKSKTVFSITSGNFVKLQLEIDVTHGGLYVI